MFSITGSYRWLKSLRRTILASAGINIDETRSVKIKIMFVDALALANHSYTPSIQMTVMSVVVLN